jgi:hypothetical protein
MPALSEWRTDRSQSEPFTLNPYNDCLTRFLRRIGPFVLIACLRAAGPQFEPNFGQAEAKFVYVARAGTTRAYIENSAVQFRTASGPEVRLSWTGAADESNVANWSAHATGDVSYYCNQPNADLCRKPVPGYDRVVKKNLYPNIDWVLYGRDGKFEYDLILHPGADLQDARLRMEGAAAHLSPEGSLRAGDILHWRPEAYQTADGKRIDVAVSLEPRGDGEFGFAVGPHRDDLDLIIDPVIQPVGVTGGGDEDTIAGTATGTSCSFRYGVTRSANWSHLAGSGHSVFAQISRPGPGTLSIFWGGDGDSQVGGADQDPVNCRLYLGGWTSAQNAPTFDAPYEGLFSRPYAGGATDGFLLEVAWNGLAFASYLGGPGADRIYDVRRTGAIGSSAPFALVGETTNSAWPSSSVQRTGEGGQSDAFAALLNGSQVTLLVIGGAGNDRAMRLRATDAGYWAIAGETDSSNFPATDGPQSAKGKDLWLGLVSSDIAYAPVLRLFGGSGDEQFGGLASIPYRGLYLAGTTNSTDLPVAVNAYQGGASDGFVAALTPLTAIPTTVTYIGGSGRDEIAAMETDGTKLLLGADTDSTDLVLPGLSQSALGGLDALFVLSDASGAPLRGIRFGGSADDRILGVEPTGFGQVTMAGASQSQDWIRSLDPFTPAIGGQTGFAVSVGFADVRISPVVNLQSTRGDLYVGRDLQTNVQVVAVSETGMDGMVVVRSSDPSRLLVSASSGLPGTDQILLTGVDSSYYPLGFTLQALADSGEVDVIVEGRSGASEFGIYPRQVLRVNLAPSALFVSSAKEVSLAVGGFAAVDFIQAPVLPDGTAGPAEDVRYGLTAALRVSSSDPSGLPVSDSLRTPTPSSFEGSAQAL